MTRYLLLLPALNALWQATPGFALPQGYDISGLSSAAGTDSIDLANSTTNLSYNDVIVARDEDTEDSFTMHDAQMVRSSAYPVCDYTLRYQKLEDIEVGMKKMDYACKSYHALRTLIAMLDKAVHDFESVDDGYDAQFDYYKKYIYNIVPEVLLHSVMFTMKKVGSDIQAHDGPGMQYFDCQVGDKPKVNCLDRKISASDLGDPILFWIRDRDGFYKTAAEAGISADWIVWGDAVIESTHQDAKLARTTVMKQKLRGFPVRNDSMVLPNPKDIVVGALKNVPDLRLDMLSTSLEMMLGSWSFRKMADPAQVYSVPVFLTMQGVDSMQQAKEMGKKAKEADDKAEEEKKRNIILLIVGVVLVFVPIVGPELAAAAGFASFARTIVILGEVGGVALGVYDTVKNPESAAVNVVGAIFGLGGIAKVARTEKGLSELAAIRGTIRAETMANFGKLFKENNKILQDVVTSVCRKA